MSAPVLALFNNKGGVGKTSLVYHLAWMYADLGLRVLVADFDPQANLTSVFLPEDELVELWRDEEEPRTLFGSIQPILKGTGDLKDAIPLCVSENLWLLAGDLALSRFEDELSSQWPECLDGKERAFRVVSAFWRILDRVGGELSVDLVLMDLGPNLGALNRAVLIAADHLVIPLAPDLFSLQGLRNMGPTLRRWKGEWRKRVQQNPSRELRLPEGRMSSIGYVVLQHAVRLDRPVKAYAHWAQQIPAEYRRSVLGLEAASPPGIDEDPHCLALLKHHRSLMPLAQEARKPIFHLKAADGAIGAHQKAVQDAGRHFREFAARVAERSGFRLRSE